ncbi:hypothetical protein BO71DRAFT_451753 [Aspergillus ellipticus CBS 707.79]|uniref:ABM domain-containing protein n=1 Tax=Aspergillus ellipticus CBS 707.79 TaxID=1448320 RepID=A0A319D3W8_9EURO|nr:hypothetical protein BO71DRAFT_451753 [Aspergillus ellipticus CBS 707.79]
MTTLTELIYFPIVPAVKPEDPSNEAGAALLDVFRAAKHQSGYLSSAWGRTVEDENLVVWAIDWKDAHPGPSATAETLTPFLPSPSSQTPQTNPPTPTTLLATLTPPLTTSASHPHTPATNTLPSHPITELFCPSFPTSLTPAETSALHASMTAFRTEMLKNLPEGARPISFSMGQVERPGTRKHEGSPSGEAWGMVVVAGWESLERHMAAKGMEAFGRGIAPVRERMLKGGVGAVVGMRHVRFLAVE